MGAEAIVWTLLVVIPVMVTGGFLLLDPRPKEWVEERRRLRHAERFLAARERAADTND